MEMIKIFIYGICIGSFEVVPGISGGTLAVLLNIYDQLISAISNIRTEFKKNFKFLFTIVSGMGVGIYVFSHIILFLNQNYPLETNFALLGLIVGLVPMIFKRSTDGKFKYRNFSAFILTFVFMMIINYISLMNDLNSNVVSGVILTKLNMTQFLKFFTVGALSAFCLMLPGCSGTMIMLVFGIYFSVIEAIHKFNFLILAPVGAGILFGLIFGAKIINYCFINYRKATYFGILGLIIGSVFAPLSSSVRIFIELCKVQNFQSSSNLKFAILVHVLACAGVLLVGTIFSYAFSKKTNSLNLTKN